MTTELGHESDGQAYNESFNGKPRAEYLHENWFLYMHDFLAKLTAWRRDYNESSTHCALGNLTPRRVR